MYSYNKPDLTNSGSLVDSPYYESGFGMNIIPPGEFFMITEVEGNNMLTEDGKYMITE